jgi:hypothetical protein
MHPDDDGLLPPIFGASRNEAIEGMSLTIEERVEAQGLREVTFMGFGDF